MGRTSTARERLLESARALIHSSNYGSASVDDLCAAAGVKKGSFYYFFPSKRDLALAVLDLQWERVRANLLEPAFAPDAPPLERIDRFFERVAASHERPVVLGCPFGNVALEMGTLDDEIREKVRVILERYQAYLRTAVQDAIGSGAVAPVDVESTSQALVALLQGALLLAKTRNDASVIRDVGRQARALLGALPAPHQSSEGSIS